MDPGLPHKRVSDSAAAKPDRPSDGRAAVGSKPHRRRADFRLEKRREFRYVLSIATAIICSWLARFLPRRFRYWLADRSGDFSFRHSTTFRENVKANLAQVLAQDPDALVVLKASRTVFRTNARNFADLMISPHVKPQRFIDDVPLISGEWSLLDEALALGKGAVVITAHLGPFDFIGHTLHVRGYKLTSVTGRTTTRFLFDAVTYLRGSQGMKLVEASPSGIRRVIQALRRGECAVLVTDRDFFQSGKPVRLFGRQTTLPPGAVRIARETGAPIVPIFAQRTNHGYGISVLPGFLVAKTSDIEADLAAGINQIVRALEGAIGATPDQWVMFQRVWPSAPVDPVRVFPIGSPLAGEFLERVDAALPGGKRDLPPA